MKNNIYYPITIFLLGILIGFILSIIISFRIFDRKFINSSKTVVKKFKDFNPNEPMKMVFCVRNDLNMGKGKIASQCAHACLGTYVANNESIYYNKWFNQGQPKIVVKINSKDELIGLAQQAKTKKIQTYVIRDAGRTQIPAESETVLVLGPAPADCLDMITGHLKLM